MLVYWVRCQGCISSGNMEANRGCGGGVEGVGSVRFGSVSVSMSVSVKWLYLQDLHLEEMVVQ